MSQTKIEDLLNENQIVCEEFCQTGNKDLLSKMLNISKKILNDRPDHCEALLDMAFAYEHLGLLQSAYGANERVIDIMPQESEAYFNRGRLKLMNKKYDEALKDFNLALERDQYHVYFHWRGLAHNKMGDLERALGDFNSAIELDPENYNYLFDRGILQCDMERYHEAKGDFEKAASINPDNTDIWIALGNVYSSLGELKNCALVYEKLDELNPELVPAILEMNELMEDKRYLN